MRASTTQKAYDEAFLACSTAVYFESQNNEVEALRSWKSALDQIYYHNAHRLPSATRPVSETDKALLDSLGQLELQCKERVDLLETLKRSRAEADGKNAADAMNGSAPKPPPHSASHRHAPPKSSQTWLGLGTIPPVGYTDLSRPPLPTRPSLQPRKSSGTGSVRVLSQTLSGPSLSPVPAGRTESRTPSPEKKGRMLKTLRPGREGKPAPTKLAASMRTKPPDAAHAATQAWGFRTSVNSNKQSKIASVSQASDSPRMSFDRSDSERDAERSTITTTSYESSQQPRAPFYFRSTDAQGSTTSIAPPAPNARDTGVLPKAHRVRKEVAPKPDQRRLMDTPQKKGLSVSGPVLPSYRNEYPEPIVIPRTLAASASVRPRNDVDALKAVKPTSRPAAATQNTRDVMKNKPDLLAKNTASIQRSRRPSPRRKGRALESTVCTDLPSSPASETEASDASVEESDEWAGRVDSILKSLPRGVDEAAAKQILNEIVIQGDEVHWDDVAGLDIAKSALKETVVYPFLRPDLFMGLREPARGMLLFGPPGTGKTMLARAVATESRSTFFAISASSLTSKFLGESEKLVRALFALAKMLAPSIIFVDEIDSLLSSRSGNSEHEATRRIKTEFLIQWSDLAKAAAGREQSERDKERGDASRVLVLAATNLPWAIDEAARRRFVRRQYIPLPEDHVRKTQMKTLLSHQKHELSDADLDRLVRLTRGFSGSDITALAKDAAMGPLRSLGEKLLHMTMDEIRPMQIIDFEASLQTIRPSVGRQGLKEYEDWAREFGERGG